MRAWQHVTGRVLAATILGAALGYAVDVSLLRDAERGRQLTMDAYLADFQQHKADLENSGGPMGLYVVVCVVMALGLFGVYEGLGFALGKGFSVLVRSRTGAASLHEGGVG